ncbi:MAG: DUF5615 family PIN-like protein [Candidatus Asgardarchaeia archaeon]
MKFLVDECVGKRFYILLVNANFDSIFVGDWKKGALDIEIIKYAATNNRIIITEDKDFGEIIFREGMSVPGIILFRTKSSEPSKRFLLFGKAIRKLNPYNKIIVISEKKIKFRELKGY